MNQETKPASTGATNHYALCQFFMHFKTVIISGAVAGIEEAIRKCRS